MNFTETLKEAIDKYGAIMGISSENEFEKKFENSKDDFSFRYYLRYVYDFIYGSLEYSERYKCYTHAIGTCVNHISNDKAKIYFLSYLIHKDEFKYILRRFNDMRKIKI